MVARRVRVGARYRYEPVMFDRLHPPYDLEQGDVVTVVNLPGCPRANTMGMCYVNNPAGRFGGMVMTNSLQPLRAAKG
jgi:hypothetical protein